ncbi:MAG: hypothetical protein VW397_05725, partial [Candidatus Margulisiibacteriota bacterium]
ITCICLFKAAFQGSMAPLIHYKKSLKILVITILGAAGNIAACYFLIPQLGISGGLIGIFVGMLVIEMGYFIEKTMLIKLVYFEIEGLIFSILYSSFIASYLIFSSPIGIPLVFINIIFFIFLFQIMLKNRH